MRALTNLTRESVPSGQVSFVRAVIGCAVAADGVTTWGTLTGMTQPGILAIPIASVPRLPPEWVNLFGLAWIISALAFAAGWPRRLSGLVLSGILAYTLVLDQQTYTNHLYLLALAVGFITLAQWRPRDGQVPAWPVFLLKSQLTVMYTFAAISKINPAFLSGAVIYANLRSSIVESAPVLVSFPALATAAFATVAVELFLAWALWFKPWRRTAVAVGVVFHASLVLLMADPTMIGLTLFAATCISVYVLFFDFASGRVTVYFDDACGICTAFAGWVQRRDRRGAVQVLGNQAWSGADAVADPLKTIVVVDEAGRVSVRTEAIAVVAGVLPWPMPLFQVLAWPGIVRVADRAYDLVARHRQRLSVWCGLRACPVPPADESSVPQPLVHPKG